MHKTDEKIEEKLLAKDVGPDPKGKLKAALIQGSIIGLGLGVVLCVWAKFIPFGPTAITLQMPYFFATWKEFVYCGFFIFLGCGAPYWRNHILSLAPSLRVASGLVRCLISACYAGMNAC